MKPYYQDDLITIYNADARDLLSEQLRRANERLESAMESRREIEARADNYKWHLDHERFFLEKAEALVEEFRKEHGITQSTKVQARHLAEQAVIAAAKAYYHCEQWQVVERKLKLGDAIDALEALEEKK